MNIVRPSSQHYPTRQDRSFLQARSGIDWQGAMRIYDAPPAITTTTTSYLREDSPPTS